MFSSFVSVVDAVKESAADDVVSAVAGDVLRSVLVRDLEYDHGVVTVAWAPYASEQYGEGAPFHLDYYGTGGVSGATMVVQAAETGKMATISERLDMDPQVRSALANQRGRVWGSCAYHGLVFRLVCAYWAMKTGVAAPVANIHVDGNAVLTNPALAPLIRRADEGYIIPTTDLRGAEITDASLCAIALVCQANLGLVANRGQQTSSLYTGFSAALACFPRATGNVDVNADVLYAALVSVLALCVDGEAVLLKAIDFVATKAEFIHPASGCCVGASSYGDDFEVGVSFLLELPKLRWDEAAWFEREGLLVNWLASSPTIASCRFDAGRAAGAANAICLLETDGGQQLRSLSCAELFPLTRDRGGVALVARIGRALTGNAAAHSITLWRCEKNRGRRAAAVGTRVVVPTGWGLAALAGEMIDVSISEPLVSQGWLDNTIVGYSLSLRVAADLLVRCIGVTARSFKRWTDSAYQGYVQSNVTTLERKKVDEAWKCLGFMAGTWLDWVKAVARYSPFGYLSAKSTCSQCMGTIDPLSRPLGDAWLLDVAFSEYDLAAFWPTSVLPAQCCYTFAGEGSSPFTTVSTVSSSLTKSQTLGKSPALLAEAWAALGNAPACEITLTVGGEVFYREVVDAGPVRWQFKDCVGRSHYANRLCYVAMRGEERGQVYVTASRLLNLEDAAAVVAVQHQNATAALSLEVGKLLACQQPGTARVASYVMAQNVDQGQSAATIAAALAASWDGAKLILPTGFPSVNK